MLTLDQIKNSITPIAEKHKLNAVWVFGSYARGDATESSDVDFLVERTDASPQGWYFFSLFDDMEQALGKKIDIVTTDQLTQKSTKEMSPNLAQAIHRERRAIYARRRPATHTQNEKVLH